MHEMDQLKEVICRELEDIAQRGELSARDLDTAYKLIVAKEKLLRIEEIEENMGYSKSRGGSSYGSYARGRSYDDGMSRGGDSYGRHYVRGHYSRGRYSMAEGKEMIVDQMREMMEDNSLPEHEKTAIRRAMEQLQR